MPINVDAAALLRAHDGGTQGKYTGSLTVKIPLVGKKVEGLTEPFIRDAFEGLERRAAHWLAR